jgi:excisionase family DNA binding protein
MSQKSRAGSADDVLTAPEAAVEKGVHRNSVLKAIRNGHLQARRSGRAWLIDRRSLELWEPRGHGLPTRSSLKSSTAGRPAGLPGGETDRQERAQRLARALDEWMADESGHDEAMWPRLKAVLEQDRLSARRLFSDDTP